MSSVIMEDLNVTHLCCLYQVGGSAGLLAAAAAVTSDLSANTAVRPAINVTMPPGVAATEEQAESLVHGVKGVQAESKQADNWLVCACEESPRVGDCTPAAVIDVF